MIFPVLKRTILDILRLGTKRDSLSYPVGTPTFILVKRKKKLPLPGPATVVKLIQHIITPKKLAKIMTPGQDP